MAPTLNVGSLGEYLREQRQSAQLSLRQLSDLAGVSNPYLSQVERGLRKPSAEVLQQLAKGLRISAEALYVRAGLLEEPGIDRTVEAAIVSDPVLHERQKRVLLEIYSSFRRENAAEAERAATERIEARSAPTTETTATPIRTKTKTTAPTAAASQASARRPRKTAKRSAPTAAARTTSRTTTTRTEE